MAVEAEPARDSPVIGQVYVHGEGGPVPGGVGRTGTRKLEPLYDPTPGWGMTE